MIADVRAFDVPSRASGSVSLTAGQETGTVSETFPDTPTKLFLSVQAPEGGDVIHAVSVGDVTDAGFDFALSAAPATDGYKLLYICDF